MKQLNTKKIIVETGYRIHVNSIDLNGFNTRVCGGLGFSVENPVLRLSIEKGETDLIQTSHVGEISNFLYMVKGKEHIDANLRIQELTESRMHVGLGSLTQLKLAVLAGIRALNQQKLNILSLTSDYKIGFTSGVGVGAFFMGGFILDGGYKLPNEKYKIINGEKLNKQAPIILNYDIPSNWKLLIGIPKELKSLSAESEYDFFNEITPIGNSDIYKISYHTLMELLPAIKENDFASFVYALKKITMLGAKPFEKRICKQNKNVLEMLESLFRFSSVSSLGPTCYSFFDSNVASPDLIKMDLDFPDFKFLTTSVRNESRRITREISIF